MPSVTMSGQELARVLRDMARQVEQWGDVSGTVAYTPDPNSLKNYLVRGQYNVLDARNTVIIGDKE